jgi:hypothetical protein
MRRSASEIIRNLEQRIARLENKSAGGVSKRSALKSVKLTRDELNYISKHIKTRNVSDARVIRSETNSHHGLKYCLVQFSYDDMFLGMKRGYAIFEIDGRNRELMEVSESYDDADDSFVEYTR